jgi:preprotein translocase subunit YajC
MLVSTAFAQAANGPATGGGDSLLGGLLPLVLIFAVFYFLLIRPQQKKMNEHKQMLAAIRRGDRVVTGGGIVGVVTKVLNEHELMVEIAEGVRVRCQRSLVSAVVAKGEPVKEAAGEGGEGETSDETAAPQAPAAGTAKPGGISALKKLFGGEKK